MKRGEIWWAELGSSAGKRPVLLLSRDEAYAIRGLITVAPITTRIRNIASEVTMGLQDGLPKPCVINLDTITTIAKTSLIDRLVSISQEKKKEVDAALHFALGLDR